MANKRATNSEKAIVYRQVARTRDVAQQARSADRAATPPTPAVIHWQATYESNHYIFTGYLHRSQCEIEDHRSYDNERQKRTSQLFGVNSLVHTSVTNTADRRQSISDCISNYTCKTLTTFFTCSQGHPQTALVGPGSHSGETSLGGAAVILLYFLLLSFLLRRDHRDPGHGQMWLRLPHRHYWQPIDAR